MKTPRLINILILQDSRKVGFGLWGFITATVLTWRHLLDGAQWIECFFACSMLVGGGTVIDKMLAMKGGTNVADAPKT